VHKPGLFSAQGLPILKVFFCFFSMSVNKEKKSEKNPAPKHIKAAITGSYKSRNNRLLVLALAGLRPVLSNQTPQRPVENRKNQRKFSHICCQYRYINMCIEFGALFGDHALRGSAL